MPRPSQLPLSHGTIQRLPFRRFQFDLLLLRAARVVLGIARTGAACFAAVALLAKNEEKKKQTATKTTFYVKSW